MVRTIVVDRGCMGFAPYKGTVEEVEPFEARKYVVGQTAFYEAYCSKKRSVGK